MWKEEMTDVLDDFRGADRVFSNFYKSSVTYDGLTFTSAEAAYQAAKFLDEEIRQEFTDLGPGMAKTYAHILPLRSDWEIVKCGIMKEILTIKFQDEFLRNRLLHTGEDILVEGNTWHDNIWGDCHCGRRACSEVGKNMLGKTLMEVRKELVLKNAQG